MKRLTISTTTNGPRRGRIYVLSDAGDLGSVQDGGDMIRNIDRLLSRKGLVRTAAFRPLLGVPYGAAMVTEAVALSEVQA
jgi:hypothetical protein